MAITESAEPRFLDEGDSSSMQEEISERSPRFGCWRFMIDICKESSVQIRKIPLRRRTYYPSIDILRGFAALSVLIYHVIETWNWDKFPREGFLSWFRIGWLGVDLFFVISGFVIGLAAFSGIDRHGPTDFRTSFWHRRLARIVPLHYLTCLLFAVLLLPRPLDSDLALNVTMHALFVHNLWPSYQGALNAPNWSLGIEMQFYLFVMFVAPRLHERRGVAWLIGMVALAWVWRFAAFQLLSTLPAGRESDMWLATIQLPGTLDEFAVGMFLAIFLRSDCGQALLTLLAVRPVWLLPVAAGAGMSFWLAYLIYGAGPSFWQSAVTVTSIRTPLAVSAALLVLIACSLNSARWLRWSAPLRYLGVVSYGIYLWHWMVVLLLRRAEVASPVVGLILTFTITLALAAFSWHVLEKPIITRFGRTANTSL